MEAIIDRTVRPMVEGQTRHTFAPVVAKVVGAHVTRGLTDEFTAPSQSILGIGLVDLIESNIEKRLRILAVSGMGLGDLRSRPADCPTQVLLVGMELTLKGQKDEASQKRGTPMYLRPTARNKRSSHGGAYVENRHGELVQRQDAEKTVTVKKLGTNAR